MKLYFLILIFSISCTTTTTNESKRLGSEHSQCVQGDLDACIAYAKKQPQGADKKTTRAAIVGFQYACFQKHPEACVQIGNIYGTQALNITSKRKLDILKNACEEGSGESCVRFGDVLSIQESKEAYTAACKLSYGPGCSRLASIYRKNWRFNDGLNKAISHDEKACELGDDIGCFSMGQAYLFGSGVEKSSELAKPYFEKSCNVQYGAGCVALGKIYATGIGVEIDLKRANAYYDLAEEHKRVSIKQTPKSAYLIFVDACNYGDTLGCFNAGWFLTQGLEVKRNITTAREFFQRACREGLKNACEKWKELREVKLPHMTREVSPSTVKVSDGDSRKIEK